VADMAAAQPTAPSTAAPSTALSVAAPVVVSALAMAPVPTAVVVAPPPTAVPVPTPVPVSRPAATQPIPNAPAALPPALSPEDALRAQRYLQRGQQELQDGNIAAARLLFRRASDSGLAAGTLALAATYDPVELSRLGAFSIQPDLAEARRWYEKALGLGAIEADARLKRLGQR
jgi:TPR repeat protein